MGSDGRPQTAGSYVYGLWDHLPAGGWRGGDGHPDSAGVAQHEFSFAGAVQRDVHHARHHDGVSGGHDDSVRVCELPCAADDWRTGHGVSAAERIQLLDDCLWRAAAVLQFYQWLRGLTP